MIALLWVLVGVWGLSFLFAVLNALLLPRLPTMAATEQGGAVLPSLSVVIPARDEERDIEAAVSSHCAQENLDLQVIVVDDGSTDRTPEILAGLAARFPRLEVLRCPEPPAGWMGKTHALHFGLRKAKGEFVLFTDADVRYAPGAHARCVAEMVSRKLDMLVLIPLQEGRGLALLVVSLLDAFLLYGMPSFLYNSPRIKALALGAGAGNLVRREPFLATGGFEAFRGQVVDDITLGQRMKAMAGPYRVVLARDAAAVRMYGSLREAVGGFSKNMYAFLGFNPLRALMGFLAGWVIHLVPPAVLMAAPWVSPALLLPAGIAVAAELLLDGAMCLWAGYPLWIAPLYPLRALLWNAILVRSAWSYYRRGVVWRGRVYRDGANEATSQVGNEG